MEEEGHSRLKKEYKKKDKTGLCGVCPKMRVPAEAGAGIARRGIVEGGEVGGQVGA